MPKQPRKGRNRSEDDAASIMARACAKAIEDYLVTVVNNDWACRASPMYAYLVQYIQDPSESSLT